MKPELTKNGWKVLCPRKKNGCFQSYILGTSSRLYSARKITVPKNGDGPMAVFDTWGSAAAFLNYDHSWGLNKCYIVSCRYEPSKHNYLWKYVKIHRLIKQEDLLPDGTVFADAVQLT